jgi:HEAT repeat protein
MNMLRVAIALIGLLAVGFCRPGVAAFAPLPDDIVQGKPVSEWNKLLIAADPVQRAMALTALAGAGPKAEGAIPGLVECIKSGETFQRWQAAVLLGSLGKPGVVHLRKLLGNKEAEVRRVATQGLGAAGESGKEAIEDLQATLGDISPSVSISAAEALWRLAKDPAVIKAFEQYLKGETYAVRREALEAVSRIGKGMGPLTPTLRPMLHDTNANIRVMAVAVFGAMGEEGKGALEDFEKILASNRVDMRSYIFRELPKIGEPAIPLLSKLLKDADHRLRWEAAEAFGKMGAKAANGLPALREALKDGNMTVRMRTAEALASMGPAAKPAVPELLERLKDAEPRVQVRAAYALHRIDKHPEGVPALVRALSSRDIAAAQMASMHLFEIGPDAKSAQPGLVKLLAEGTEPYDRARAASLLGSFGPAAKDAVPQLKQALHDPHAEVRIRAAGALFTIDKNKDGLPVLIKELDGKSGGHVRMAAVTLMSFRGEGMEAVPRLVKLLKDADSITRAEAMNALRAIDPETAKKHGDTPP